MGTAQETYADKFNFVCQTIDPMIWLVVLAIEENFFQLV